MMYSEFLEITEFTEKGITFTQYQEIEKIYMDDNNKLGKVDFCKWFYDMYSKTVHATLEKEFKNTATNLEFLYDRQSFESRKFEERIDRIRNEKTDLLIKLLQ